MQPKPTAAQEFVSGDQGEMENTGEKEIEKGREVGRLGEKR